jgi:hypothetical protein
VRHSLAWACLPPTSQGFGLHSPVRVPGRVMQLQYCVVEPFEHRQNHNNLRGCKMNVVLLGFRMHTRLLPDFCTAPRSPSA